MNPGNNVESPKSMVSASRGIAAPAPTPVIFPSVTTTSPGATTAPDFPSNIRAAFRTTGFVASAACAAITVNSRKSKRCIVCTRVSYRGPLE